MNTKTEGAKAGHTKGLIERLEEDALARILEDKRWSGPLEIVFNDFEPRTSMFGFSHREPRGPIVLGGAVTPKSNRKALLLEKRARRIQRTAS